MSYFSQIFYEIFIYLKYDLYENFVQSLILNGYTALILFTLTYKGKIITNYILYG